MDDWAEIRRLYRLENLSQAAMARRLSLSRNTEEIALARRLTGSRPPTIWLSLHPC